MRISKTLPLSRATSVKNAMKSGRKKEKRKNGRKDKIKSYLKEAKVNDLEVKGTSSLKLQIFVLKKAKELA